MNFNEIDLDRRCNMCGKLHNKMIGNICPKCAFKPKANNKVYKVTADHIYKTTVDHPSHYNNGKIEAIEVIEDWKLNFNLGNAVKYIARAGHKNNRKEDLEKALWYIKREIERGE